ncbi:MAG: hypothetical protein NXI28_19805, partial [bacterium]|nr:hypothetical protein [bacterium]
ALLIGCTVLLPSTLIVPTKFDSAAGADESAPGSVFDEDLSQPVETTARAIKHEKAKEENFIVGSPGFLGR